MRRAPALLLLVVLLGGLTASAVHHAEHAADWAEGRTHQLAHHGTDGVQAPCVDGEVHALDCAVCSGVGAGLLRAEAPALALVDDAGQPSTDAVVRGAATDSAPARGPPAVA